MNLKRLVFAGCFGALAFAPFAFADRTDVWSAASVNVTLTELHKLPDGGCAVLAVAAMTKQDGGVTIEASRLVEVSGANRTTCLDILNTKAPVLFKTDKDL